MKTQDHSSARNAKSTMSLLRELAENPPKKRLTKAERIQAAIEQAEANVDDVEVLLNVARSRLFYCVIGGSSLARKSEMVSEIERGICDALRVVYRRAMR
jgi:hypothetical protein